MTINDVYREGDNAGEFLGDTGDTAGQVGTTIIQGMFSSNGNGQSAGQSGDFGAAGIEGGRPREPQPDEDDDDQGVPPEEVAGAFFQGGNGIRVPDVTRSVRRTLRNRLPW